MLKSTYQYYWQASEASETLLDANNRNWIYNVIVILWSTRDYGI